MAAERPRLLHRRLGYTDRVQDAMSAEPEAVPADYQRRLTRRAAMDASDRRQADWRQAREELQRQLDWLRSRPLGQELASDLRVLERWIERLDRRLGVAA